MSLRPWTHLDAAPQGPDEFGLDFEPEVVTAVAQDFCYCRRNAWGFSRLWFSFIVVGAVGYVDCSAVIVCFQPEVTIGYYYYSTGTDGKV